MSCVYCPKKATTTVNIGRGRKLQMVDVCPTHRDQLEHARARDEEAKQKAKEMKRWW